jgi:ribosomal protein S12 methylthiotransferase accessory factor
MADLVVTFPGGKKVDAHIGEFTVRTDQPVQAGGEGSAPSPFLYCLVAMGTCAGIYVLSYLQARGLPTEGMKILQTHESDPRTGRIGKVRMELVLPKGVGSEHHPALVRSAEKCAVKKLIEQPPEFEITASASA